MPARTDCATSIAPPWRLQSPRLLRREILQDALARPLRDTAHGTFWAFRRDPGGARERGRRAHGARITCGFRRGGSTQPLAGADLSRDWPGTPRTVTASPAGLTRRTRAPNSLASALATAPPDRPELLDHPQGLRQRPLRKAGGELAGVPSESAHQPTGACWRSAGGDPGDTHRRRPDGSPRHIPCTGSPRRSAPHTRPRAPPPDHRRCTAGSSPRQPSCPPHPVLKPSAVTTSWARSRSCA